MALIPEILIDAVNGPTLTFVHADGSSSSLSINATNQLVAMSGSTPIPYASAYTASYVSYSNIANVPAGIVSSSAQVVAQLPSGVISSSAQLPAGVVSSSAQVLVGSNAWSSSAQLPSGVVSASAQVLVGSAVWSSSAQLPSGTVSSSAQVLVGSTVVSSSAQVATLLPTNTVSSSAQVVSALAGQQVSVTGLTGSLLGTATTASYVLNAQSASFVTTAQTASFVATSSWSRNSTTASYVDFVNVANKPTLVSSSAQVLIGSTVWSSSAQLPSGVVSASAQVLVGSTVWSSSAQLPANIISSSAQVVSSLAGQQVSVAGITGSLLGTASYATQASTASYVNLKNVPSAAYVYGNKTTTQTVTVANTFQQVTFDAVSSIDASAWTFSTGTSTLTCAAAGTYAIDAMIYIQKTSGTATVGGVRLTKNGNELPGSFQSYTFASNNVTQPFVVQALDTFAANDVLNVQLIGGGTNIQIAQAPAVGGPIMRPSATIRVLEA